VIARNLRAGKYVPEHCKYATDYRVISDATRAGLDGCVLASACLAGGPSQMALLDDRIGRGVSQ